MTDTDHPAVALLHELGIPHGPAVYQPSAQDRVPMARWGKDHWSTLAYVECRIVDQGGRLAHDHMRAGSHHPAMIAAKRHRFIGDPSADGYPTLLAGGVKLERHDDYDCIDDMIAVGLVEVDMPAPPAGTLITGLVEQEMMARAVYRLTPLGQDVAGQLRAHKGAGGNFASFVPVLTTQGGKHGSA